LLSMFAPATSGLSRKRFRGRPAAAALARRCASPSRPVLALVPAGVNGLGLKTASGFVKSVLLHEPLEYSVAFPAFAALTPLK
jgi:hypothetical protein